MDGFGFQAGGLGQALGGTAGRGTQQHVHLLGLEDLQNTRDDGGFADPRPTGDDGDFAPQGQRHGLPLRGRQGPTGPLLHPGERLRRINGSPGQITMEQSEEMGGDADLSTLEGSQEQAGFPVNVFSDEVVLLAFELDGLLDDGQRDFQERDRRLQEFLMMDGTVTIVGKLLQHMTDASLGTDHRVPRYAQPLGQAIRRLKANAMDIESQTIGILPDLRQLPRSRRSCKCGRLGQSPRHASAGRP